MSKKVNSTISSVNESEPVISSKVATPVFSDLNSSAKEVPTPVFTDIMNANEETPSSNRNWLMYGIIGVVILVVLGLLGFGIYMLVKEYKDKKKETSTPTPKPPSKPTPPKDDDEIPSIVNPVAPTPKPVPKGGHKPNDLIGILVSNEKNREPLFFPLHGRKIASGASDMWYYYTKVADIVTPIISQDVECGAKAGCKEMGNNTIIVLKQFPDRKFTVKLYKKRGPEYASQRPYEHLGTLVSQPKGKVPLQLPLYGRELTHRDNRWQYYTKVKTVMVPMFYKGRDCQEDVGCDELNHGSTLTLDGYGKRIFTVQLKGKSPVTPNPPENRKPKQRPRPDIEPIINAIDTIGLNVSPSSPVKKLFDLVQVFLSNVQYEMCAIHQEAITQFKKDMVRAFAKVDCTKLIESVQTDLEKLGTNAASQDILNLMKDIVKVVCKDGVVDETLLSKFIDKFVAALCDPKNKPYTSGILNNKLGFQHYEKDDKIILSIMGIIQAHYLSAQSQSCNEIPRETFIKLLEEDIKKIKEDTSMTCDKILTEAQKGIQAVINEYKSKNPSFNTTRLKQHLVNVYRELYNCKNKGDKLDVDKFRQTMIDVYDSICTTVFKKN